MTMVNSGLKGLNQHLGFIKVLEKMDFNCHLKSDHLRTQTALITVNLLLSHNDSTRSQIIYNDIKCYYLREHSVQKQ